MGERQVVAEPAAPGVECCRPLDGRQRLLHSVEMPERRRRRADPLDQKHVLHDPRGAGGLRAIERIGERRRGVRVERVDVHVEREVDARQLAIELAREIAGARAQAVAHARALRLAHLAEPPVLQCAERRQRRDEHADGEQLRPREQTIVKVHLHEITVSETPRRRRALYISYKTIAER